MTPFFADDESPELHAIRSQILRYRASDLMNDRERAAFFGLPEGCRMRENAKIISPELLKCGKNVWIGEGAMLDASGGLEIGDNTQIGVAVLVWSHSSHQQAIRAETGLHKESIIRRPTKIGSNCFIVGPTSVGPGVTIGDGVIVSPLSFVQRDLPDGSVYNVNKQRSNLEDRIADLERQVEELRDRIVD